MANEEQTPQNPAALTGNRFYDDPDVLARTRNEGHRNLLVDELVARTILQHLPEGTSDEQVEWARRNARHAKKILFDYEDRGYKFPDSPDNPDNA